MDLSDFWLLLKQYGPLVLVVVFFLWQNWLRELRMSNRINEAGRRAAQRALAYGGALHGRDYAEHDHDGAAGEVPGRAASSARCGTNAMKD